MVAARLGNMTTNEAGDQFTTRLVQVLDVGCGVASFSAYLLPLDIHTTSFAPKDGHENQIQFIFDRGIGAMILMLVVVLPASQLICFRLIFKLLHLLQKMATRIRFNLFSIEELGQ
ncbi:hypothetical protein ZIOFF_067808 [Zingiber officinale]|uniref:Methyltransferase n=1 Tax=Zingiber officinale TaxID=94328 RepID=A0A8J5C669_ZINOF|nr:hypothetical protein ZIOFF_067808 [Zingiber officinale]